MKDRKLPIEFFQRSTKTVARELLGKKLVHVLPSGERLAGLIVETEAYLGVKDRACHTFKGKRTPRVEPMYLAGGHAYIYFIYGMYHCFNIVTEKSGTPEAVLIRALEPIEGIELMMKNRKTKKTAALCSGPGKLCQALKLDRQLNGQSLTSRNLFLEEGLRIPKQKILVGPRIGIAYAQEAISWPLRFFIGNNPHVSPRH